MELDQTVAILAAIIATDKGYNIENAVERAFRIEKEVLRRVNAEYAAAYAAEANPDLKPEVEPKPDWTAMKEALEDLAQSVEIDNTCGHYEDSDSYYVVGWVDGKTLRALGFGEDMKEADKA